MKTLINLTAFALASLISFETRGALAVGANFKCPEPTRQIATLRTKTEQIVAAVNADRAEQAQETIVNLWAAYPHSEQVAIYQNLASTSCYLISQSDLTDEKKIDRWMEIIDILDRGLRPEDRSAAWSAIKGIASSTRINELDYAGNSFTTINIRGIANYGLDWLVNPPRGKQEFDGIPFYILSGDRAVIHTRNYDRPDLPIAIRVPVGLRDVKSVNLLLNGNWIHANEKVGTVRISYTDGPAREVPLKSMQTIRETWMPRADLFDAQFLPPPEGVTWDVVYSEGQMRGATRAIGFLDKLSIDTDPTRKINEISIYDSSWQAGSGIIISAITLEAAT